MSREPVELTWEGGEHPFYLGIRELRALQKQCDAGPAWIFNRLERGDWLVDDVVMTIRLGLEGGGLDKAEAKKLIEKHVENEPLMVSVITAHAVLASVLLAEVDDPVGEFSRQETDGANLPDQNENLFLEEKSDSA